MTNQTNRPNEFQDAELDGKLDGALRKMAKEIHPRPAFVTKLRGELETQAAHPRRSFWSLLNSARPWLAQAVLIGALAALVLVAGSLTGRLFAPDGGEPREIGANLTPAAAQNASLPVGALARLGKGKIQSLDAAPDGRIAVGSTASLCVFNDGLTADWCRWTDAPVHEVRFDPTGTWLAVRYGTQNLVEIWDAAQGQVIASREFTVPLTYTSPSLPNPNFFMVEGLAWEPAGSRIAVIETGQGISAWDWQNDAIAWGPVEVGGEPIGVEWLTGPEGESIIAALTPESLTLVDGSAGQAMSTLSGMAGATPGSFLTLARAAQGSRIAVGSDDKISVFDLAAWNVTLYQSVPHPAGRFQGIALSADGTQLAAQTDQTVSQIITFDLRTGQETGRPRSMPRSPMVWEPEYGRLFYASAFGSLGSFSGNDIIVETFSDHTLPPQFAAWRDDKTLITVADNFIYTWDLSTQSVAIFAEMTLSDDVTAAGLSKDGTRALFFDASANDVVNAARIIVWDVTQQQPLHDIEVGGFVHAVTLSPDGTRLAAVHESGQIFTWKLLDNGAEQIDLTGITNFTGVDALAFHPNGEQIAIAYTNSVIGFTLEVWSITDQALVARLAPGGKDGFSLPITSLDWSADGTFLSATQGQEVEMFEMNIMQQVPWLAQPDQNGVYPLRALQFHPFERETVAAAENRVHVLSTSEQVSYSGHTMGVTDLAFSPDGEVLASASSDGTVILWNLGAASLPPVEVRPTETPLGAPEPVITESTVIKNTPTSTPPFDPSAPVQEYTVVEGDVCSGIAFNFGISVDSLIALNNLSPKCDDLYVGQVLLVPYPTPTPLANYADPTMPSWQEYVVAMGDTCVGIAYTFNISLDSLIAFNGLASNCEVYVGQKLRIPYPTPTPYPTLTQEITPPPGSPTPLPNATQHPLPDTTGYDVTQTDGISPSGKWRWIAIHGEWRPGAPREQDLNFIIAASTDGTQTWVIEEWTPHGLGEGRPTGFTFSADDRYLFFYDTGEPDGCGQPWQTNLRRMDLQNGIVNVVPLSEETLQSNFAFSQDASRLALVTRSHLEIYDLAALQMIQQIPIPFSPPPDRSVSFLGWQSDTANPLLAFEIVSPPESQCSTPESEYQRWTVVTDTEAGNAWSFPNAPGYRLRLWSDDREGSDPGSLIYHAFDGSEIIVDPRTGDEVTK